MPDTIGAAPFTPSFSSVADLVSGDPAVSGLPGLDGKGRRDPEAARQAAEQFEAYLFTFMAKSLRATVPEGVFSSGAMQTFGDLFDQEIGKRVGEAGLLGLADQLEQAMISQGLAPPRDGAHADHPSSWRPPAPVWGGHQRQGGDAPWGLPSDDGLSPTFGVDGRLTSGFGPRRDPIHGQPRMHKGLDLAAPMGTPIHAVRPGTVTFAGPSGGHGNFIIVDHGGGVVTRYAHCSTIGVKVGDRVDRNQVIGGVGSTGHSTGPHLHFEVYVNGSAVDPLKFRWSDHQGAGIAAEVGEAAADPAEQP